MSFTRSFFAKINKMFDKFMFIYKVMRHPYVLKRLFPDTRTHRFCIKYKTGEKSIGTSKRSLHSRKNKYWAEIKNGQAPAYCT